MRQVLLCWKANDLGEERENFPAGPLNSMVHGGPGHGKGRGYNARVPRTGWVYRNVKKPESVSDHMYRMAMMSLTITDPTVDKDRCIKLALVHDMAECIVGDIAPSDNISKAEKHRREEARGDEASISSSAGGTQKGDLWTLGGRFHHPDVLQLLSSLNEERGCKLTKTDETKNHGHSQTTGASPSQPRKT
ncbi:hypothetical protein FQN60_015713 [Etheostoma spectabile]|uniref:HD domain-containing protein n=1 Tax=Etheostoma spectabile TaxID=54343 RepID=A0A5J5CNB5_9PERO|nr:hypothetical protein FQN60_015713 [Etheostoma spectabile]